MRVLSFAFKLVFSPINLLRTHAKLSIAVPLFMPVNYSGTSMIFQPQSQKYLAGRYGHTDKEKPAMAFAYPFEDMI